MITKATVEYNNRNKKNLVKINCDFDIGLDNNLRLVMRSAADLGTVTGFEKDFKDTSFITINKEDAQNLYDMLCDAIERLKSGTREDDYREVFGNRAISFERLADYLNLVTYDINDIEVYK